MSGNWANKPIRYGVGLLDAKKPMLTPSAERTEEKLEVAPTPQTVRNMTQFQEPTITGWWKRKSCKAFVINMERDFYLNLETLEL